MGFGCGFDIYPRLEATAVNKETYQRFLNEITHRYEDVYDKEGRRADGKVLAMSTGPDPSDKAYIWFMVGECPHLPSNPDRCDYFLRFSSKISGRLTAPAESYIRGVHKIARKYFGSRVHFWHEMHETNDKRQWGYYDWQEVHDTSERLRVLETGQECDLTNRARGEQRETESTSLDATAAGLGHPSAANLSQASNLVQDHRSSQSAPNQVSESSSLLRTNMEGNVYAVRLISGKGQGLIATSKIRKGTRILSEEPIFKVPRDEPDRQVVDGHIIKALKSLDRDNQRAFFALHNAYGRDHSPFLGIARTNVLPLGSEAREGGLFLVASRINHSCRHNAQNTWNANIGRLTIHALSDIEEGQEITISYLSRRMEYIERQRFLKEWFYFDCRCDLCVLLPAQREESDLRLSKIQSIDDDLGDLDEAASDYDTGLHLVRTMLWLLEEEGVWDAGVPRVYYDAFQIAIANGDEARAKVFAERSYAARVIIEGDDSPEVARLKQLADRPAQHRLYKTSVDSPQGISPPQEMDGLEFDDWLWRKNEWSKHPATSAVNDPWDVLAKNLRYGSQSLSDEGSEGFDSLSNSSVMAALLRSMNKR